MSHLKTLVVCYILEYIYFAYKDEGTFRIVCFFKA